MSSNVHQRQFTLEDLVYSFRHHPPSGEAISRHEQVRAHCLDLAVHLNDLIPDGREKAIVMHSLEDVLMRANRAIALDPSLHKETS